MIGAGEAAHGDCRIGSVAEFLAQADQVAAAHVRALTAFADAIGVSIEPAVTFAEEGITLDGRLDGPFAPGGPDDGRIRVLVGTIRWVTADEELDSGLIAQVRDIWLPRELQRAGYGHAIVDGFVSLWRPLGLREARAPTVRLAGKAAFRKWGWKPKKPDGNCDI